MKVLSFWALCDRNLFLSMLDKAANDGHWLVFNNSHLLEQLDDDVVAKLSHLISSVKGRGSIKISLNLFIELVQSLCLWILLPTYVPHPIIQRSLV